MRFSSAVLLAITSFFATVSAVPAASTDALGTVTKVWPNGMVEYTIPADEYFGSLHKRQTIDLSGATCESTCSGPPGPGPNQNDCNVITNEMLSEGTQQFSINPNFVVFVTFASCRVNFVNQTPDVVVYQENDFGSVASFLAGECNAAHGFSVGQCTFDEQPNAFIQVLHS
ncbi:hypothetical protein CPB84DRAFT_1849400 [Gymnopilus junonius]|uniref:Uncharacterized protein n=1 Tax=Gymnopilus junonius TaxID=109634 RepID=A0A9P5TJS9_GYMJU|nr:hypothetical protein CPB84DRAFT_1849400 [Gymnopilus junonius]